MSVTSLQEKMPSPDLSTLKMGSVMTPIPITIDEDTDLATARHTMREKKIRHLPVLHNGKLTGILSDRDLKMVSLMPDIAKMSVAEIMTRKPSTVHETTLVVEALSKMSESKFGSLIVTKPTGEITGIFTTQDALRLVLGEKGLNIPPGRTYPPVEDDDEECIWD